MATTKHSIPAGYNFAPDLATGQADAFFAWLAANQINPAVINPDHDVVVTATKDTKGVTWALTAATVHGDAGTWPLIQLPTIQVVDWLKQFAPKPVDVAEIKQVLDKLADARARESAAKAEAEELRAEVMGYLTTRGSLVGTIDGVPFVQIKPVPMPGKFARKAFEAEYPEIAERFTGNDYDQNRVEFL
jgi:hypothetical protein